MSPLIGVSHNDTTTLSVIFIDTHLKDFLSVGNAKFLVDFVFNWETMAIPTESSFNVSSVLRGISADDILYSTGKKIAVVGQACSEGWTVVECERRAIFGFF